MAPNHRDVLVIPQPVPAKATAESFTLSMSGSICPVDSSGVRHRKRVIHDVSHAE